MKIQRNENAFILDYRNSHGSWIVDSSGRERLDCFSQYASQPLGWNHPKVQDRASRLFSVAMHNPANSDVYTHEYLEFIKAFEKITPDFDHLFFISGGTLGVENALKAAFDWKMTLMEMPEEYTDYLNVIHFKGAFHGRSGYTLSMTNTHDPNKYRGFPKFKWTRVHNPHLGPSTTWSCEEQEKVTLQHVEKTLREQTMTAAIVIEPIQGEGGDNHFRPEFLRALRKLADQHFAMLIFDEVQTGVGMTGKMWCYEHFGFEPDMICFGKKSQVCGFACNGRINSVRNVFDTESRLCSTWGGNLTDMVRATIYLEIIEEDKLVDNARVVGDYLLKKMDEAGLTNVRGRGLMTAFDLPSPEQRDRFMKSLSKDMLALKCGERSVRLRPHLTFSKADADEAVRLIKKHI